MFAEVRRILRDSKGSRRKRQVVALLHVVLWPVSLIGTVLVQRRALGQRRKILLIRIDGIGDLVMSSAIFPALRRKYPDARIDLLTSDAAAIVGTMLVDAGWLNNVHVVPLLGRGLSAFRTVLDQLKPIGYDVTIDLRGDSRNVLLMSLLNAPRRIGLFGSGFSYLLTDAVDLPAPHHQADEPTALVARLGVTDVAPTPSVPVADAYLKSADRWLAEHGMVFGRPIVAFHLTAFQPSKVWPLERFIEAARQLRASANAQFVVVGGKNDLPAAQQFAAALGEDVALAAASVSLMVTAAIFSRCALLIGNDSGPGHLAGAMGCATIILFGNGNPKVFGVRSPRAALLRSPRPCNPRCDKTCAVPQQFCMLDLEVDQVVETALASLKD